MSPRARWPIWAQTGVHWGGTVNRNLLPAEYSSTQWGLGSAQQLRLFPREAVESGICGVCGICGISPPWGFGSVGSALGLICPSPHGSTKLDGSP